MCNTFEWSHYYDDEGRRAERKSRVNKSTSFDHYEEEKEDKNGRSNGHCESMLDCQLIKKGNNSMVD